MLKIALPHENQIRRRSSRRVPGCDLLLRTKDNLKESLTLWQKQFGSLFSLLNDLEMQFIELLRIYFTGRIDHQVSRRGGFGKRHYVANVFRRHQYH